MKYFLLFALCVFFGFSGLHAGEQEFAKKKPTVIIMLGGPGAGKGSQAVKLKEAFHLPHISTGDLFRENIKNNTPIGKKAKTYMDSGKLVPDDIVIDMLMDRVSRQDAIGGYILDGFPRTLAQAEALDTKLSPDVNVIVINLDVNDDIIVDRITGRLVCPKCGTPFHKIFKTPKVKGVCDECGATLQHRSDDSEEIVRQRLRIYHEQSEPLIAYYKEKGVLHTINGDQPFDKITEEIIKTASNN
ncbi:MAG: adenylate kinase [Chlamydiia bacterium]|nr:adenylate kinase [Chlamydiia bacterium]